MFGWNQGYFSEASCSVDHNSKKIQELRTYYEGIDTFIIDEINAMSAAEFTFLQESLSAIKNKDSKKDAQGNLLPFEGVQMVFMGDTSQLAPVAGPPMYGKRGEFFESKAYVCISFNSRSAIAQKPSGTKLHIFAKKSKK